MRLEICGEEAWICRMGGDQTGISATQGAWCGFFQGGGVVQQAQDVGAAVALGLGHVGRHQEQLPRPQTAQIRMNLNS